LCCSPIMSSQTNENEEIMKKTTKNESHQINATTKPAATTQQRNVKVGTLEDASDPNNQQNTKDG
jgi:hypothetical protein